VMVCAAAVTVTGEMVALTPPVAAAVSVMTTVAPTRSAAVGMTTARVLPHSTDRSGTSTVACPKGVTFASKTAVPGRGSGGQHPVVKQHLVENQQEAGGCP
jgi:hypothetical protein